MSTIVVVPDELGATASRIDTSLRIADEVRSKHSALQGAAAAAGRSDLEDAISSFFSTWSYGLECIDKDGQTLASFLRQASDSYLKAEAAIAEAASR